VKSVEKLLCRPQSLHNLLLWDVLEDAGKHSNVIRANTRCYLALYLLSGERQGLRSVQGHTGYSAPNANVTLWWLTAF
jgi:hypothetical protein